MAGLLGFTLADLASTVDARKRQAANLVRGLLSDPGMTLAQLAQMDAEQTQRDRATLGNSRSVMPEVRQQAQEQDLMNTANAGGLLGMIAYHGSPHKFDKFDMSKIGTGEGAQAYGHGLYFSEAPSVAKTYQGKVSAMHGSGKPTISGKPVNWDDPLETAAFELSRHNGDREAAAEFFERTFKKSDVPGILRSDKALPKVDMPGSLYKVDITDDAVAKMLDWDKPLSQQPDSVRKAVKTAMDDAGVQSYKSPDGMVYMGVGEEQSLRGSDIYKLLTQQSRDGAIISGKNNETTLSAAQRSAAEYLRALDIPGIRYLDAGSRGKGGTSNFVLFDDQLPKIVGRE